MTHRRQPTEADVATFDALNVARLAAREVLMRLDSAIMAALIDDPDAATLRHLDTWTKGTDAAIGAMNRLESPVVRQWAGGGRDGPGTGTHLAWRDCF